MNKPEWIIQRKVLLGHLKTAKKNKKTASDQIEELELTIAGYDVKIETFK